MAGPVMGPSLLSGTKPQAEPEILEALIHQAWSEIEQRLAWAEQYILRNAVKSQQRKSRKDKTLGGIFTSLNS